MAAFNKIQQFVEDIGKGVHNLDTGALTIALSTTANVWSTSADAVLGDVTQISYTNVVTTPTAARVLNSIDFEQTTGTAALSAVDMVITATGGAVAAFGVVGLYNDTPSSPLDPLICWWEYGSDVTLATSETFTIDFAATILTIA